MGLTVTLEMKYMLMVGILIWILMLEVSRSKLSDFAARKLCHAGCGLGMIFLDSTDFESQIFVWCIAAGSIAMTWNMSPFPPFRFSRPRDVGVTAYLMLVSASFAMKLSPSLLAPLFFADPAGAVIGKFLSRRFPRFNIPWYQKKTIGGSAAVFVLTYASIGYSCTPSQRAGIAILACIAEALGGAFDNLAIAAVVFSAGLMLDQVPGVRVAF